LDTKWKNRKKAISFLLFFLGVSLTLGSLAEILRRKPAGVHIWELDRLLEDDYQESARFRAYVAGRLEDFLIMATGGEGLWGIRGYEDDACYGSGKWYDGGYGYGDSGFLSEAVRADLLEEQAEFSVEDSGSASGMSAEELADWLESLREMQEGYQELLDAMDNAEDSASMETFRSGLEVYRAEMGHLMEALEDNLPDGLSREQRKPLTEEQKQKIAGKYHDSIKGDKNLLYAVAYDGKVLYSNSDLLGAAPGSGEAQDSQSKAAEGISTAFGDVSLPEGYNFLLYFNGEKVRILKDGREVDVYGDGYYREDSDWYVPGYANFRTDDAVKKAAVCMAVAKAPVLYMEGSYQKGGSMQYDNSLYWMDTNLRTWRQSLTQGFTGLAAGLGLLIAAFLLRKSGRQAKEAIARFQARIWLECKILLLLALVYGLWMLLLVFLLDYGYMWEEALYAYEYNFSLEGAAWVGRELISGIPPLFWILLFWGLWLPWNDLQYNRKIWRCSLTAKLYRTFSAKNMNQPLPRKMSRRNKLLFFGGLIYALLMMQQVALVDVLWKGEYVRAIVCLLAALETILFLAVLYLTLKKNMKAAREVEALSRRITEIRNGDYGEGWSKAPGSGPEAQNENGEAPGNSHDPKPDGSVSGHEAECSQDLQPVMARLEDIRHGMAAAVDEQMKSQRMKVELIANVSHDIKTPLTSIISYVELLKQEEGLPDHIRDYVRILDEKSQRLKNMVTDVFAVSKAASGELPMEMEELDFGKLLRQTLADMEEQIEHSSVVFRTEIPDAAVTIMADGQRLYRVFQNLFQNAIKYSLQGSRVYVALHTDGSAAVASVKNTSSRELEKGKDFAERFARGDASRTDGGSGLGLSIAQSFTEACGGEFTWETDADLFIVKIAFQVLASDGSNHDRQ
jgi:signal transduction histidine kinase/F0F1-type ATP synthase membrane subunit c/vacuolar-type H+-ATPase subunit K